MRFMTKCALLLIPAFALATPALAQTRDPRLADSRRAGELHRISQIRQYARRIRRRRAASPHRDRDRRRKPAWAHGWRSASIRR